MPTLLEQLDAAESTLRWAEERLTSVRAIARPPYNQEMLRSAEVDVMAASAHASLTAARCMVAVEDISDADAITTPLPDRVEPAPQCCQAGAIAAPAPCPWHPVPPLEPVPADPLRASTAPHDDQGWER